MPGEPVCIDGGRRDDDLQVRPARQQLLQVTKQEIDVQAALVRLVDDDRVVLAQQRIGLGFGQQDAVGHQLDPGAAGQGVGESHLEADMLAGRRAEFESDALGSGRGGNPAWLRMADQASGAAAERQADLR